MMTPQPSNYQLIIVLVHEYATVLRQLDAVIWAFLLVFRGQVQNGQRQVATIRQADINH